MRSAEDEAKDAKKTTDAEKGEKAKKSAAVEGKKVETKAPKKEATAALPDDVVTQIAQAKYEAQEDKLRDVARHSMALIRDFQKLDEQDCIRKIADIQRSLVKYEMQYIRAWEIEEHRRSRELVDLEAMRARFRKDAETEERQLEGQRKVLQKGLIKRKRYEGYEELATAVNSKRPQHDSKAEIERVTADLSEMRAHGERFGRLAEFRDEKLKILVQALADLDEDAQAEQAFREETFPEEAAEHAASIVCEPSPQNAPELVEVVS